MSIDANKSVTVTLPAGYLGVIRQVLCDLPYKHVHLIIKTLDEQIRETAPEAFDMAAALAPRVNGVDALHE